MPDFTPAQWSGIAVAVGSLLYLWYPQIKNLLPTTDTKEDPLAEDVAALQRIGRRADRLQSAELLKGVELCWLNFFGDRPHED